MTEFVQRSWKGILICFIIALPSWFLGHLLPVVGGPVFSILIGMAVAYFLNVRDCFLSLIHILKCSLGKFNADLRGIVADFDALPLRDIKKPKVGIVGEILVKYHPMANNDIVDVIEAEGGEAVVLDLIDFFLYGMSVSYTHLDHAPGRRQICHPIPGPWKSRGGQGDLCQSLSGCACGRLRGLCSTLLWPGNHKGG